MFITIVLLLGVFLSVLHVSYLLFTNFNNNNLSSCSVFVHLHVNIEEDTDLLQSNNSAYSNDLWLLFSNSFLLLKVWFNKISIIMLRIFFNCLSVAFLHKHINTPDNLEAIRSCGR